MGAELLEKKTKSRRPAASAKPLQARDDHFFVTPHSAVNADQFLTDFQPKRVSRFADRARLALMLVAAVAVVIRLAYVSTLDRSKLTWSDEWAYDRIGWQLAQTGHYESSAYSATPVLPAFLAIVYKVFGHSYTAARVSQVLLSAILVLAMFWLADTFFGRKTAYVAALGTAFYPPFIYLSAVLYAEHTYLLLTAVTLCCLARWQQRWRTPWLVAAGIMMGLTALSRPVFVGFFPFAAAYVWWRAPRPTRIRCSVFVCAVAAATIAPWTIRNALVFKHFVPISSGVGVQLWCGNNDLALGDTDDTVLRPLSPFWKERAQTLLTDPQRAELTAHMEKVVASQAGLDEVSADRMLVSRFSGSRRIPGNFWLCPLGAF
jgi:4-amino-4-deoxy-L-arabinose transferase-like glycosyltransferase